jgi:hypothetical protein
MSDEQNTPAKPSTRKAPVLPKPDPAHIAEATAQVAAKPQIRNRHDISFRHDVFVSDQQEAMRDISYQYLKPEIVKVPHKHIFHSHSNAGKKLSRTGAMAGHWHDVIHGVDPKTGEIFAKCGPAMQEVTEISQTGRTYTKIQQVTFEREITSGVNAGATERLTDDHTHELVYLGSEELSPLGIQKDLEKQKVEAQAYGISLGEGSVKDTTPAPLTAADGVTMT